MSRFWSKNLTSLVPYVPGEQPKISNLIKLNTNENPYAPSSNVLTAIREAATQQLRRYPELQNQTLREHLGQYYQLSADHVFVGNGSDEVLAHAFYAFFRQSLPILFADITYSFYPVYCQLYDIQSIRLPLDEKFQLDLSQYYQPNGGIIIANPNAPTTLYEPLSHIKQLLIHNRDSVVIIDEAYIDFGGESAAGLIHDYPNLLIVQTASKSRSLAGLRIGWALGHPDLIAGLTRVKDSFNSYPVNQINQAALIASLKDEVTFQTTNQKIIDSRTILIHQLDKLGFHTLDSKANFIFTTHPQYPAMTLYEQLRAQGILVRYFKQPERISHFLRISIGNDHENASLIHALTDCLQRT